MVRVVRGVDGIYTKDEAKDIKRGVPLLHRYILEERRIDEGYMYGLRMGWV